MDKIVMQPIGYVHNNVESKKTYLGEKRFQLLN